jgi:DNA-binding NtrC family response regulator
VDDDDAVRAMMNATLERKGFTVVAAASVTEALRWITTECVDVLTTDLHVPDPVTVLRLLPRCATPNRMH